MGHEDILTALADPTRRAVLDRLREGPSAVGRIADTLPVTRPAVSQHLKVLLDAGLVSMERRGTRNLYSLTPGGAGPLTDWLGALRVPGPSHGGRSLTTRLARREAWHLFCEDLAIWWPVARVSLSAMQEGALPQAVLLEPRPGGALREVLFDGTEGVWANVVEAQAPSKLVLDWKLGAQERVTVTLAPEDGGARLTLDHSADTSELWDPVLDRFAAAANAALSNF